MSNRELGNTGYCDSNGSPIHFGDRLKRPVDGNTELHGSFALYDVIPKGCVPFLSYKSSEFGQILPEGMTGCVLTELYDPKDIGNFDDMAQIRPIEELVIIEPR